MSVHVSILTPSFNQADWLKDNLRSVRNQTYDNIEHIVMDGGSSDSSRDILEAEGDRIIWKSEPDRGQSHALNKAYQMSWGDIIGWLNSDDAYVDRNAVQAAVDVFESHPHVGVIYGHGLLVSKDNQVMQFMWSPPYSKRLLRLHTYFIQPSAFIRRSVIEGCLVNEELHYLMDRDLWLRLSERTTFARLNQVVALDRHQPFRKTLTSGYVDEVRSFREASGVSPDSTFRAAAQKAVKVVRRVAGVPGILTLTRGIDPAIDLSFDSVLARMAYQTVVPRSKMRQD